MYKSGDIITYRDTPYTYQEWTTWNGKPAKGFNCNDETLLSCTNTVSFGTITEEEMHERIDDYIDNAEEHLKARETSHRAAEEFYKTIKNE
jgi:hypothetical protein